MSPDPAEEFANPYSYVGGNTPNRVDPDGLSSGDDVVDLPTKTVKSDCPDANNPDCPTPEPTSYGPIDYVIAGVALAVGSAWASKDWIGDQVGSLFSSSHKKHGGENAPSPAPPQDQTTSSLHLMYPTFDGLTFIPDATTGGSLSEIPVNDLFDYYRNRGKTRVAQSRHPNYQNGETYYDAQELFGGILDMAVRAPLHAQTPGANTTVGVMPDLVSGPEGAGLSAGRKTVSELIGMMNKRPNVLAEFASGDAEAYLKAINAEGAHMLQESGSSHIILRQDVATRHTAFHEWLHRVLQRKTGGPTPGEDGVIEKFLKRHKNLFGL